MMFSQFYYSSGALGTFASVPGKPANTIEIQSVPQANPASVVWHVKGVVFDSIAIRVTDSLGGFVERAAIGVTGSSTAQCDSSGDGVVPSTGPSSTGLAVTNGPAASQASNTPITSGSTGGSLSSTSGTGTASISRSSGSSSVISVSGSLASGLAQSQGILQSTSGNTSPGTNMPSSTSSSSPAPGSGSGTSQLDNHNSSRISSAAIAGGTVGGIIVIIAFYLLFLLCRERRRRRKALNDSDEGQLKTEDMDLLNGRGTVVQPFERHLMTTLNSPIQSKSSAMTSGKRQIVSESSANLLASIGPHAPSSNLHADQNAREVEVEYSSCVSSSDGTPPTDQQALDGPDPGVQVINHEDSGVRMPVATPRVVEFPPVYSPF